MTKMMKMNSKLAYRVIELFDGCDSVEAFQTLVLALRIMIDKTSTKLTPEKATELIKLQYLNISSPSKSAEQCKSAHPKKELSKEVVLETEAYQLMSVLWQTLNTHAKENGLSGLVELEPKLNAGEVELPDVPKLTEQLLTLVLKGSKVTHQPGDHDDYAAATAVAVWAASSAAIHRLIRFGPIVEKLKSGFVPSRDHRPGVADSRLAQGRDVYASMQRGGGRL